MANSNPQSDKNTGDAITIAVEIENADIEVRNKP